MFQYCYLLLSFSSSSAVILSLSGQLSYYLGFPGSPAACTITDYLTSVGFLGWSPLLFTWLLGAGAGKALVSRWLPCCLAPASLLHCLAPASLLHCLAPTSLLHCLTPASLHCPHQPSQDHRSRLIARLLHTPLSLTAVSSPAPLSCPPPLPLSLPPSPAVLPTSLPRRSPCLPSSYLSLNTALESILHTRSLSNQFWMPPLPPSLPEPRGGASPATGDASPAPPPPRYTSLPPWPHSPMVPASGAHSDAQHHCLICSGYYSITLKVITYTGIPVLLHM